MGKVLAERTHYTFTQWTRQQAKAFTLSVDDVSSVTREKFVPSVAGKNNGDMFTREFRNHVSRNSRGVSERFVKMPHEFIDDRTNVWRYEAFVMVGGKFLRGKSSVLQLVVAILVKADGKSLHRLAHVAGHHCHYGTRINSAGEKSSK